MCVSCGKINEVNGGILVSGVLYFIRISATDLGVLK
jgi:hypothetical protein